MKKANKILWGVLLVALGVIFLLNALDVTDVDLFFDGWWTLFIIIPCTVGLFTERDKVGNLIGLAIGVILLLWRQDIVPLNYLWKIILPAIVILVGLRLILEGFWKKKKDPVVVIKGDKGSRRSGVAVFSGCDLSIDGEVFEGADLVAVFGGVECDLRRAVIEQDCVINVTSVFGGVDVLVPPNVQVKTDCMAIFGGVDNVTLVNPTAPTVYIKGLCLFGGVEVK
ncbi:MAG: hypothetical protein IKC59_02270 [Clostridia bacterium]|nr:hypothetical protein [Clostridia bacterium]